MQNLLGILAGIGSGEETEINLDGLELKIEGYHLKTKGNVKIQFETPETDDGA